MNLSLSAMSPANRKIAERLFPDFDARDTSGSQIEALMNAVREEANRQQLDRAIRPPSKVIIRELLAAIDSLDSEGMVAEADATLRARAYLGEEGA